MFTIKVKKFHTDEWINTVDTYDTLQKAIIVARKWKQGAFSSEDIEEAKIEDELGKTVSKIR